MWLIGRWPDRVILWFTWGLAAYLRLANVTNNPAWSSDEGTHLDIARHLASGRVQYLAINQSTLLFAKLPLFDSLLALLGPTMSHLRLLSGGLGLLSVGLLYAITRYLTQDEWLALLAGLMLAIYRPAVIYNRFGFSYNLLTPLVLLAWLALAKYEQHPRPGYLALASSLVGLGLISDLIMGAFIPLLLMAPLVGWQKAPAGRPVNLIWPLLPVFIPFALYATMAMRISPEAFWFDLRFTLARMGGIGPAGQLSNLSSNLTILLAQDSWLALGIAGLFLLRPEQLGRLTLLFWLLPILVLGRTNALHGLSFYYMIPLLPLPMVGLAALVRYGLPAVTNHPYLRPGLCLLIALPFFMSTKWLVQQVQGHIPTDIEPFLLRPEGVRQVAAYVNDHTKTTDLVIASPAVAWLLNSQVADFQMAVALSGRATPHLPANIPAGRFAFDPAIERARYVIIDNLWLNWAVFNVPSLPDMIAQVKGWPMVFAAGDIQVYQQP